MLILFNNFEINKKNKIKFCPCKVCCLGDLLQLIFNIGRSVVLLEWMQMLIVKSDCFVL